MRLADQKKCLEIFNGSNFVNVYKNSEYWDEIKADFDREAEKYPADAFLLMIAVSHFFNYTEDPEYYVLNKSFTILDDIIICEDEKEAGDKRVESFNKKAAVWMCIFLIELEFFLIHDTKYPYDFAFENLILDRKYSEEDFKDFLQCEVYYNPEVKKDFLSPDSYIDSFTRQKTDESFYDTAEFLQNEKAIKENRYVKFHTLENKYYKDAVNALLKKYGTEQEIAQKASKNECYINPEDTIEILNKYKTKYRQEILIEELKQYLDKGDREINAYNAVKSIIEEKVSKLDDFDLYMVEVAGNVYAMLCCLKYGLTTGKLEFLPDVTEEHYSYEDISSLGLLGVPVDVKSEIRFSLFLKAKTL